MKKPYEKYKPSVIESIGEIPKHWNIKPIKYLLKPGKEGIRIGPFGSSLKSEFLSSSGYKVYGQENVINNDFNLGWRYINDNKFLELSNYEIIPGDVLVTMMGTTGKCKVVPRDIEKGIMDSHLIRMRIDNTQFESQLFADLINESNYVFNQIKMLSKGSIMEGLNSSIIKSILLIIPSPEEQTAIAAYLDEKTAQIDTLIANKQKLIDLLKEERTAIINEAVTRGLNHDEKGLKGAHDSKSGKSNNQVNQGSDNVRMKPSGIEWLGDIPKHWGVKKLKYVARLKSGDSITADSIRDEGEYPVFGGNGLRGYTSSYSHEGDFVLIGRQGALCGNINYATGKFWASEHAVVAAPIVHYKVIWLGELLRAMNLNQYSQSAAQPGLAVERIQNLSVPVPPYEEQEIISDHIETETQKIDATISKIEKEIELMQEYRTALISEAVTGKIKIV